MTLGCCNFMEKGIVRPDQHCNSDQVRSVEEIGSCGWGGDDGEGGEERGLKVWPPRQSIRFTIAGTFPVGDGVVVGN